MSRTTDKNDKLYKLAIIESLKSNLTAAAEMFDLDEDELKDRQLLFLLETQHVIHHKYENPDPNAPLNLHWTEKMYQSPVYELAIKVGLTLSMALVFWVMPNLLKGFVDPLTNTIIWSGFTTLYLLSFLSLGIELIFWAGHNVNFRFFNRFYDAGVYDYESFLTGDKLTEYEKCKLNQAKYLCYLCFGCYILGQLLNLLVPA